MTRGLEVPFMSPVYGLLVVLTQRVKFNLQSLAPLLMAIACFVFGNSRSLEHPVGRCAAPLCVDLILIYSFQDLKSGVIIRLMKNVVFFSFLGWGETESNCYVGH
jgi:hypothetical protein